MLRRFVTMILFILLACGCSNRPFEIENQTASVVHVQVSYMHLTHKLITPPAAQYSVLVEPGTIWSTRDATPDEQAGIGLRSSIHGGVIGRVRMPSQEWSGFSADSARLRRLRVSTDDDRLVVVAEHAGAAERPARELNVDDYFMPPSRKE